MQKINPLDYYFPFKPYPLVPIDMNLSRALGVYARPEKTPNLKIQSAAEAKRQRRIERNKRLEAAKGE